MILKSGYSGLYSFSIISEFFRRAWLRFLYAGKPRKQVHLGGEYLKMKYQPANGARPINLEDLNF